MTRSTRVPMRREHTGDAAADRMQRVAQQVAEQVGACPFISGRLKSLTFTAATALTVNHGLGTPAGWIVVRGNYDGTGNVARLAESGTSYQAALDQRNQISLVSDANCTVDIWFYPRASKVGEAP